MKVLCESCTFNNCGMFICSGGGKRESKEKDDKKEIK